jgi:hypothetical protein
MRTGFLIERTGLLFCTVAFWWYDVTWDVLDTLYEGSSSLGWSVGPDITSTLALSRKKKEWGVGSQTARWAGRSAQLDCAIRHSYFAVVCSAQVLRSLSSIFCTTFRLFSCRPVCVCVCVCETAALTPPLPHDCLSPHFFVLYFVSLRFSLNFCTFWICGRHCDDCG